MPGQRKSYEDSCLRLQKNYLDERTIPPIPQGVPGSHDDEPLGVSFFRTFVGEGDDLSNLTLPRTFFGRSEINDASFQNTDLAESNLCWNDFIDVDFTESVLAGSDMRASVFERCKFVQTDLRRSDMRHSTFVDCDFTNAQMHGTILTNPQAAKLNLSIQQRNEINWAKDDGPEPEGG